MTERFRGIAANRRWRVDASPYFGCIKATVPKVILRPTSKNFSVTHCIVRNFAKWCRRHTIEMQIIIVKAIHFSTEVGNLDFLS